MVRSKLKRRIFGEVISEPPGDFLGGLPPDPHVGDFHMNVESIDGDAVQVVESTRVKPSS